MKYKFCLALVVFTLLSLSAIASVNAAGTITLSSTTVAAGDTVTVSGSGFNNSLPVAIAIGPEVPGSNTDMAYTGTGVGPYSGSVSHYPIKPGSFVLTSDTSSGGGGGIVSTYTDTGVGTTTWSYDGTVMGTVNYVTGAWSRTSTADVTGIASNYSATYIYYQYSVTPATGVNTTATGTFSAPVTVPLSLSSGTYTVTVVDTAGNIGTATLTVTVPVPENFSLIAVILLSTMAIVAGLLWKNPRNLKLTKL